MRRFHPFKGKSQDRFDKLHEDISVVVLPFNKDIPTGDNGGWGTKDLGAKDLGGKRPRGQKTAGGGGGGGKRLGGGVQKIWWVGGKRTRGQKLGDKRPGGQKT